MLALLYVDARKGEGEEKELESTPLSAPSPLPYPPPPHPAAPPPLLPPFLVEIVAVARLDKLPTCIEIGFWNFARKQSDPSISLPVIPYSTSLYAASIGWHTRQL